MFQVHQFAVHIPDVPTLLRVIGQIALIRESQDLKVRGLNDCLVQVCSLNQFTP